MAKKSEQEAQGQERQSRKDILRARKQEGQKRKIRIAVAIVAGLILMVAVIAIVNELIIAPKQAIATVGGQEIPLGEWQDRVSFERAQLLSFLDEQSETLEMEMIQSFAQQYINALAAPNAELFAESVLDQMVDEAIIQQAAEARGITVSEADIDEEIGENFNYFGGDSPTPFPSPTETIEPTPSLTPIPTAVITDIVPTAVIPPTPTTGPTSTPPPTATPVSEEAFQQEFDDYLAGLGKYGVDTDLYREIIRAQLYRQYFSDVLAEENALPTRAEHASFYLLMFDNEADAETAFERISNNEDYLAEWNMIHSVPAGSETAEFPTALASEMLWQTEEALLPNFGAEASEAAFLLPLNVPSDVLVYEVDEGTNRYFLIMVNGREERDLAEAALEGAKSQLLTSFLEEQRLENTDISGRWRQRVPSQPLLDPAYLIQQPTVAAPLPEQPLPDTGQ